MLQIILIIIGMLILLLGVVCIFDARVITKRLFGFGDQNEASMGLKIVGFIFSIVGSLIALFNIG